MRFLLIVTVILLGLQANCLADGGFAATWKLFHPEQKAEFVAGYMNGFKDAAAVTDIAISYLKENPNNAVEGLTKLKKVYDLSGISAHEMVAHLDRFFADPDNKDAGLSLGVTSVRR